MSASDLSTTPFSRRRFIRSAALATGAFALAPLACSRSSEGSSAGRSLDHTAIQLYTLRDLMPGDPMGVLSRLAAFGYTHIESYAGPDGICWGMEPADFRNRLAELGLTPLSTHADLQQDPRQVMGQAAEAGFQSVIVPWIGPQESLEDYRRWADRFNQLGAMAAESGLRFAYHNHDYSFREVDGVLPHTLLLEATDPALVEMEMDVYWVAAAGQDPVEWIERHPGRFTHFHIKDLRDTEDGGFESCTLGTGRLDFAPVLQAARANGGRWFIVEQEAYTGTDPMASSRDNAAFMATL